MDKITITNAKTEDLAEIMRIYAYARQFMKNTGNATQWGNGYPSEAILNEDIEQNNLYIIQDSGRICGAFAFIIGKDETYSIIEDGEWLSDSTYGTIHRVAGDGTARGIFEYALQFCKEKIDHLRIDTHNDNKVMQHIIEKNGFTKCGIIYADDGTKRIAYEKL